MAGTPKIGGLQFARWIFVFDWVIFEFHVYFQGCVFFFGLDR